MKMFKAKKIKKRKRITKKIFIFFFFFSYIFSCIYIFNNKKLKLNIDNDINYFNFNLNNLINKKIDKIIINPVNFLNSNIKKRSNNVKTASKKVDYETKKIMPIIYLYNTHSSELYTDYSIIEATSYLKTKLKDYNIDSIKEEKDVYNYLLEHDMKYYESYKVSLDFMQIAKENNSSLNYFFDIHRDSTSKDKSTLIYNSKSYAKILFIIGLDNNNYNQNLENTEKLNNIINSKIPNISRGIYKKGGKGVNGVYNQNFSSNVFLIEVGAKDNTKEEVINTIEILSESIKEYLNTI